MNILYVALLLLGLAAAPAAAQDLLTRRTGEEIAVKVLEVTPSEVKYRRTDNPDGPLVSVWRTDVFMIRYANGLKEVFDQYGRPFAPPAAAPAPAVAPTAGTAPRAGSPAAPATGPAPAAGSVPTLNPNAPDDTLLDEAVHLDGPRLGITVLTGGVIDKARESLPDLNPFLTQFGWQFESRLFRLPNGTSAVAEFVPLIGGLEQGKFLPSISGILGVRGPKGFEFGLGPNVTPLGTSIVLAVGTSFRSNGINFPVNVAVVPGNGGVRISLLVGFNARRR